MASSESLQSSRMQYHQRCYGSIAWVPLSLALQNNGSAGRLLIARPSLSNAVN